MSEWDDEADRWATYEVAPWGRLRLDLIADIVDPLVRSDLDVLDLGGGLGETASRFAIAGARVTLVDRSPAMVERAKRAAVSSGCAMNAVVGDVSTFPVAAAYDVVLLHNVLAFVEDGESVVARAAGMLRPGGTLSITASNRRAEPMWYALFVGDLAEARRWAETQPRTRASETFDHDMRLHDADELASWVTEAGLEVIDVSGFYVVAPYLPDDVKERDHEMILDLERALARDPSYRDVGVHLHVLARRS